MDHEYMDYILLAFAIGFVTGACSTLTKRDVRDDIERLKTFWVKLKRGKYG
jgi:hypothetical protein